jgi:hypothetical protein
MMLVAQDDVEARLGRPLTSEEEARFPAIAEDVTAVLYSAAPRIPVLPPVPPVVTSVASNLAIRMLATEPGGGGAVQSESLGGYSVTYQSSGDSASLSDVMLGLLKPWRASRMGSAQIVTGTAVVQ